MISFNHLGKYGQLCNQLFQISCVLSTALKYKTDYTFNAWKYNKYLENPIPTGRNKNFLYYNEPCFHYKEIKFTDHKKNWDLKGYFQSEKYFENHKDVIRKQFTLKKEYRDYIIKKYPFLNYDNTCSIHIRRGDFLELEAYHNVLPLEYYNRAIEQLYSIGKVDINFIVCSDDIEWCKKFLPRLNVKLTFIEGEENIIDLHILSMCRDNIMSASSFSWWGAWLNDNPDKRVIAPKNWFGPLYKDKHNTKDLIPENWVRI